MKPPDVRPVYFHQIEGQWELLPHLRAAVRFQPGNLTDPLFLASERPYDLILCRNLFIYLTPDARVRALANFDRLLALDGWLCVTPTEADRLPPDRFVSDGPTEFGIYRRRHRNRPTRLAGARSGKRLACHRKLASETAAPPVAAGGPAQSC